MTDNDLRLKSIRLRKRLLEVIYHAGAGHTGGSLSCLDILNVLYNRILRVSPESFGDPNRDRYIQSKGHSVEALYVVLADRGFFPEAELDTLCRYQSRFIGHPTRKVPGIEMNTGALGHGLPISVGLALAGKMDQAGYRVFTLLGDGELAEGSNWEAAMAAAHYRLDNLTAILDHNTLADHGPHPRRVQQRAARREIPRVRLDRSHRERARPRRTDRGLEPASPERPTHLHHRQHGQGQGSQLHGGRCQMAPPRPERAGTQASPGRA